MLLEERGWFRDALACSKLHDFCDGLPYIQTDNSVILCSFGINPTFVQIIAIFPISRGVTLCLRTMMPTALCSVVYRPV